MFSDIFTLLTASVSPVHRALGYLDEALAMRRRAVRNATAWRTHLDNTREFVLSAVDQCVRKDKVVILGSGLLLDVPLPELAGAFREVVLMDVVCLPEARRALRRYPNVRFAEHDVTGVAEALYRQGGNNAAALPEPRSDRTAFAHADLVVSLNILSQLWVVPRSFSARRFPGAAPETVDEWCRTIVERHYEVLRSLSCEICLVADHAYVKRDSSGAVISRGSTVFDLGLPKPQASWAWHIVPIGRDSPHTSKELIVGAWKFSR